MTPQSTNKALRTAAIVLLALTAAFTLLGGIGTSCVAFNPLGSSPSMARLAPVQPVFILLVIVSIIAGGFGIYTTVQLVRGRRDSYSWALVFLLVGGLASAVQFYFSLTLRGSTAPNNIRLYITLLTLAVFLLLRLPGVWRKTGFGGGSSHTGGGQAAGLALFLCGLLTLAMPIWGAPTHVINGFNTVNILLTPLMAVGLVLTASGMLLLARAAWPIRQRSAKSSQPGH